MPGNERSTAGYKAVLRNEKKSDWKTVEQITYRAFRDAPPTGSDDDGNTMYYPGGVTNPDYCVLKFTAVKGRYYSNFKSEDFEV